VNRNEAHKILDEQKDGTRLHPVVKVTQALWTTGDISSPLPKHARPFDNDGINEWLESLCVGQSERTGESLLGDLQRDQSGIDQKDERNQ
jgi:hypothetical protein